MLCDRAKKWLVTEQNDAMQFECGPGCSNCRVESASGDRSSGCTFCTSHDLVIPNAANLGTENIRLTSTEMDASVAERTDRTKPKNGPHEMLSSFECAARNSKLHRMEISRATGQATRGEEALLPHSLQRIVQSFVSSSFAFGRPSF